MDDAAKPIAPPATAPAVAPGPKRAYTKPTLIDHGTVSELTRGGVGTSPDGSPNKKRLYRP